MAPPSCALTWLSCGRPVFPDAKREDRHRAGRFLRSARNHWGANRTASPAERVRYGAIDSIDPAECSHGRRRSSPRPIERTIARWDCPIERAIGSTARVERSNRRITWMHRRAKRSTRRIERSPRRVKCSIRRIRRSHRRVKRLIRMIERSPGRVKRLNRAIERSPRRVKRLVVGQFELYVDLHV